MKGSLSNTHADFRGEIWGEKKNILNYYTQVDMGTKIENNKFANLFFPLLKQHTDCQL